MATLGGKRSATSITELSASVKYLWFIYYPSFAVASAFILVRFSEDYPASWIYHAAPVKQPGYMMMASFNTLFIKYFLPLYILFFGISLYVWKLTIVDDFLFGLINNYFCLLASIAIANKYLPFSRPTGTKNQSGRSILIFIQMIFVGLMAGIHYWINSIPGAIYIIFVAEIFLCWLIRRELRNLAWKKISV
ncbi:MAG: hypothetical protein QM768_20820 [Agriterribacter sp.]